MQDTKIHFSKPVYKTLFNSKSILDLYSIAEIERIRDRQLEMVNCHKESYCLTVKMIKSYKRRVNKYHEGSGWLKFLKRDKQIELNRLHVTQEDYLFLVNVLDELRKERKNK